MRFGGRTASIIGGAIGFGRAFARALVGEGAAEEMNGHGPELACVVVGPAVAPSGSAVYTSTATATLMAIAQPIGPGPAGRRDDFDPDQRHSQQQHRRHRPQPH